MAKSEIIVPKPVGRDARVALIGPATRIKPEITDALIRLYEERPDEFPGKELIVYPSALDINGRGSYAASLEQRVADFTDAWSRDDVGLVICARGGYGCVHLLDYLSPDFIASHPKWLVGFSDVSALHALLFRSGVASIHGGMAKQLVEDTDGGYGPYRRAFCSLLESGFGGMCYSVAPHEYDIFGAGSGVLLGGNLAVLNGLAATPFDMMAEALRRDVVLFLEDVSEPIYAVERMLFRLYMQGVLGAVRGILIGQFTDWRPDRNYCDLYDMIHDRFTEWGISCPVVFRFPVGHNEYNVPLVEGVPVRLEVTASGSVLTFA